MIKKIAFVFLVVFLLSEVVSSSSSYNVFRDKGLGYQIGYSVDWIYEKPSNYQIVFSGKKDTPAYYSTVSIQNIASKKTGGKYESISPLINVLKNQFKTSAKNTKIYNEKTFIYTMKNGIKLTGREFIIEYTRQGENFKQWEIVVPRVGEEIFYVWAYTSPVDQYNTWFNIAKEMLNLWVIF
ncbi:MAG: hypothetical protein HYU63_05085 [Armatimonadetes bacterium]|nr:hypothetical protein [Armatimonadota bacterium]